MEKKIIGIISGKGGVGKTSLTASLARLAQEDSELNDVIVMDCDVDAPNLAIILPPRDESKIKTNDIYATLKATFLEDKCVHCKECIDDHFCEFNALRWNEEREVPIIDYIACEGCGACETLCPEHAFEINAVKSGEIISYDSNIGLPLAYGKTRLGSTTSGKLVSDAKEHVKNEIKEFSESDLIIIDGPPGIGCPVIATVSGLDYVIAITEPIPSGMHDLKRAIELITQFKIPFGIIVNKADMKSPFQKKFEEFIVSTGYEVLGKIPFDLSIPRAMSHADDVIHHAPESKASHVIRGIYENLLKVLWNDRTE